MAVHYYIADRAADQEDPLVRIKGEIKEPV